jgi:hypothetical protein
MWKANGKTTTLQLFLHSLPPKNMRDSSSGDTRKLKIALFGDLSLEEAMDLSRDRQILQLFLRTRCWTNVVFSFRSVPRLSPKLTTLMPLSSNRSRHPRLLKFLEKLDDGSDGRVRLYPLYNFAADRIVITAPNNSSIVSCIFVSTVMYFNKPWPRERVYWAVVPLPFYTHGILNIYHRNVVCSLLGSGPTMGWSFLWGPF